MLAVVTGEPARTGFTGPALLALAYLIVFGSLVAYTAYTWLLDHVAPRIAGTYAFVNPVVAVLLGWWLLDERLSWQVLAATAVIAAGVALIVLAPSRDRSPSAPAAPADEDPVHRQPTTADKEPTHHQPTTADKEPDKEPTRHQPAVATVPSGKT